MFESITINLEGPICKCKTENLGWGFDNNSFGIWCKTCNTVLKIGKSVELVAWFNIKKPYPNKRGTKAKLYSIKGDK